MQTTDTLNLEEIMAEVKKYQHVEDKINISRTYNPLGNQVWVNGEAINQDWKHKKLPVSLGDDCAAIPDGHGDYMLFAAEGIVEDFIRHDPWFAGYSAVMVNINDICAMGGLPLAVTDVIWSNDTHDARPVWEGMKAAARTYQVPVVGGHTCYQSKHKGLSVSILGKAQQLITSFDALPGDKILMAVDLNGEYFKDYPFWNTSTNNDPERLREIIRIPAYLANQMLCYAGKDISMGGVFGTLKMLVDTSAVGAKVFLDQIPDNKSDLLRWLLAFPSYGYLLATKPEKIEMISNLFHQHDIACAEIGEFTNKKGIEVYYQDQKTIF